MTKTTTKEYRQFHAQRSTSKESIELQNKLDVDSLLSAATKKKNRFPHLTDLIEYLVDEWGGAKNFARCYYDEFKNSKSVMARSRMLDSILKLIQVQANIFGPPEDITTLSDVELREAALALLNRFNDAEKSRCVEAGVVSGAEEAQQGSEDRRQDSGAEAAAAAEATDTEGGGA